MGAILGGDVEGCVAQPLGGVALLPFDGMRQFLYDELGGRFGIAESHCTERGSLVCVAPGDVPVDAAHVPYWTQVALLEPQVVRFGSIGQAAQFLRGVQRSWAACPSTLFRRTALIQQKLPYIHTKPRAFPFVVPGGAIGAFTLLDEHTMLCSAVTSSRLPCGALVLQENHDDPPSRAYLKLQEALCVLQAERGVDLPGAQDRCLDAGACPGGWTWVLRQLGAPVVAVDRSPLAPALMADGGVTFMQHDAFTLTPQELGAFDWVLSDVICYPARLLDWVRRWIASGMARRMVCTIKLQGKTDWQVVEQFASIPGGMVRHLNYNKHELTFLWAAPEAGHSA